MIRIRKGADRGHFNHGWLDTYHTFSFGDYDDPAHMSFRSLRVMNDDRVHPGHARKMAAKLQDLGHDAWFYELDTGGHSHGKPNREWAAFMALAYTFLHDRIGWRNASPHHQLKRIGMEDDEVQTSWVQPRADV